MTLKLGRGQHSKYLPFAFTEQGVAMLSSVLRSKRAVQVNIEIMRAFVRLRREIVNPYSYAGVMATTRAGADGSYNISYGLDGSVRLRGDDYLGWAFARSVDERLGEYPVETGRHEPSEQAGEDGCLEHHGERFGLHPWEPCTGRRAGVRR